MRKVNCMLKVTCMRAVIGDPTKQLTTSTKIYIGNRIIMNYSTAMLIFNFLIFNLLKSDTIISKNINVWNEKDTFVYTITAIFY